MTTTSSSGPITGRNFRDQIDRRDQPDQCDQHRVLGPRGTRWIVAESPSSGDARRQDGCQILGGAGGGSFRASTTSTPHETSRTATAMATNRNHVARSNRRTPLLQPCRVYARSCHDVVVVTPRARVNARAGSAADLAGYSRRHVHLLVGRVDAGDPRDPREVRVADAAGDNEHPDQPGDHRRPVRRGNDQRLHRHEQRRLRVRSRRAATRPTR